MLNSQLESHYALQNELRRHYQLCPIIRDVIIRTWTIQMRHGIDVYISSFVDSSYNVRNKISYVLPMAISIYIPIVEHVHKKYPLVSAQIVCTLAHTLISIYSQPRVRQVGVAFRMWDLIFNTSHLLRDSFYAYRDFKHIANDDLAIEYSSHVWLICDSIVCLNNLSSTK